MLPVPYFRTHLRLTRSTFPCGVHRQTTSSILARKLRFAMHYEARKTIELAAQRLHKDNSNGTPKVAIQDAKAQIDAAKQRHEFLQNGRNILDEYLRAWSLIMEMRMEDYKDDPELMTHCLVLIQILPSRIGIETKTGKTVKETSGPVLWLRAKLAGVKGSLGRLLNSDSLSMGSLEDEDFSDADRWPGENDNQLLIA
ncbi:hypothetical protein GQ53DRAFT_186159 [Thozetella sp. PMI_491]|nr:hypothetical protein GQ53DRAFT_186159 [Thozetella sp. PMI_491]